MKIFVLESGRNQQISGTHETANQTKLLKFQVLLSYDLNWTKRSPGEDVRQTPSHFVRTLRCKKYG